MVNRNLNMVQETLNALNPAQRALNELKYYKKYLNAPNHSSSLCASVCRTIDQLLQDHAAMVQALLFYGEQCQSQDESLARANNPDYQPPEDRLEFQYQNAEEHKKGFWEKTFNQVVLGDFSEDTTWLGTTISLIAAFAGVDAPMDARDLAANVSKGEWGWAVVNAISLIPVVGVLGKGGKALAKGGKAASKTADAIDAGMTLAKHGDDIIDTGEQILKHGDDILDAGRQGLKHGDDILDTGKQGLKHGDDILDAGKQGLKHGDDILDAGKQGLKHGDDILDTGKQGVKYSDDGINTNKRFIKRGDKVIDTTYELNGKIYHSADGVFSGVEDIDNIAVPFQEGRKQLWKSHSKKEYILSSNFLTIYDASNKIVGKVDGVKYLPGYKYIKRPPSEVKDLRKEFKNVRKEFVSDLATHHVDELKKLNLSDKQISDMLKGRVPKGFQIHHKLPLDDGGSNAFSNLILIHGEHHKVFTFYQNTFSKTKEFLDEGYAVVDWVIPTGPIYIPEYMPPLPQKIWNP